MFVFIPVSLVFYVFGIMYQAAIEAFNGGRDDFKLENY